MNPYSRIVNQNEIDISQAGLVGAWKLKPEDEVISDLVGTAHLSRVESPVYEIDSFLDTIRFDGSKNYLRAAVANYRNSDLQGTISFWFKPNAIGANQCLFCSGDEATSNYFLLFQILASNVIDFSQKDNDTIDAVSGDTVIQAGKWYHVTIISSGTAYVLYLNGQIETLSIRSGANNGDWFADTNNRDNIAFGSGRLNTIINPYNGQMRQVEIFSDVKSANWVQQKYLEGANTVQFKTDYGVIVSAATELSGNVGKTSPFRIGSGSWKITEDIINGKSVKVVECIAAGFVAISTGYFLGNNSEAAYGTWKWWIKKAETTTPLIIFIASAEAVQSDPTQNGYDVRISNSEQTRFRRITAGAVANIGDFGPVSADVWLEYETKRDINTDELVLNVDGTEITAVVDANHTISNYVILELGTGDKFSYSDLMGDHSFIKRLGV